MSDLTCLGLQLAAVTARTSIHPSSVQLLPFGTAKQVGLLFQVLVQGILDTLPDNPVHMVFDLPLINPDQIPRVARLATLASACHNGLRLVLGNGLLQLPPLTSLRSLCNCALNIGCYRIAG